MLCLMRACFGEEPLDMHTYSSRAWVLVCIYLRSRQVQRPCIKRGPLKSMGLIPRKLTPSYTTVMTVGAGISCNFPQFMREIGESCSHMGCMLQHAGRGPS